MKELKINFTDFWPNYDKKDNYFYNLLKQFYRLLIDENPDLLIYLGNKQERKDFISQRFLNYNQFESEKDLIKRILEIDQKDDLAIDMIMQPIFSLNKIPHDEEHNKIIEILSFFYKK